MAKYSNRDFENLDITKDELKNIGEALKKDEFRKLLSEYVDEVTDPKNRALYEKEITLLEKQRGVDITFIHPKAGYVIKSSVDGVQKVFINVCSNINIEKPCAKKMIKNGVQGSDWSIPHIITPPKVDLDKKGQRCVVYDVVFNPQSLEIAKTNGNFRSLLNDTAISGVEDSFNTKIDRNNIRFPKMDFKGPKVASIIRKKSENNLTIDTDDPPMDIPNYPYEPIQSTRSPKVTNLKRSNEKSQKNYTTPNYIVKHRKGIDLQEFSNKPDAKLNSTVPTELIIEVDLPLLSSVGDALLDVSSRSLSLVSEKPKYKLEVNLPYPVDESVGSAKFDKKTKKLIVNLPVVQKKVNSSYLSREDSGIESDPCHNRSSSDEDLSCQKVDVISPSGIDEDTNSFRTNAEVCEKFFSENIHYSFPSFSLTNYQNNLTLTLNVKNIDPTTVFHQFVFEGSGAQIKCSSLGSGCFPIHYAICVQFPGCSIDPSTLKVEAWDNNLIVYMKVISESKSIVKSYYVGCNKESLVPKDLPVVEVENKIQEEDVNKLEEAFESAVILEKTEIPSSGETSEREVGRSTIPVLPLTSNQSNENTISTASDASADSKFAKKLPKVRAVSESNAHPVSSEPLNRRSILKTSRSLSESNFDEYTNWSSIDSSDITEDSSSTAVKKTVRFSDVISKKIFRANSSIIGQKHKNEKKARNRKKMAKRRISESETSEVSDFSDYSEVSDVSDLSEASDASSDDQPNTPSAQVASGKRHRRRGSKNGRKNAATAKQNSFLSQD